MAETKQQRAERMADFIVHIQRHKGECTDDDLRGVFFSEADITRCGPLARGFAAVALQANAAGR